MSYYPYITYVRTVLGCHTGFKLINSTNKDFLMHQYSDRHISAQIRKSYTILWTWVIYSHLELVWYPCDQNINQRTIWQSSDVGVSNIYWGKGWTIRPIALCLLWYSNIPLFQPPQLSQGWLHGHQSVKSFVTFFIKFPSFPLQISLSYPPRISAINDQLLVFSQRIMAVFSPAQIWKTVTIYEVFWDYFLLGFQSFLPN